MFSAYEELPPGLSSFSLHHLTHTLFLISISRGWSLYHHSCRRHHYDPPSASPPLIVSSCSHARSPPSPPRTMDSRQPQHGFHARPQDRLIQNPNHQPNMQPQHPPYPSYAPSTSQPPVHVPFSDPFPRHNDPFMPASQHQRRASYGLHGGDAAPSVQADNRAPLGGAWGNNGTSVHSSPWPCFQRARHGGWGRFGVSICFISLLSNAQRHGGHARAV